MANYSANIYQATVWEDASLTIMARVRGLAGAYITQASLSSIACKVYDLQSGSLVTSPTVTVASAVFDTLQDGDDDPRWTLDSTGFNFRHTVPAAGFPDGNKKYRVEYSFVPASGDAFPLVVEVFARALMGS